MLAESVSTLPCGGPLNIDSKVAQVLMSHLGGVCAETEEASETFFNERDALLALCSPEAVAQVALVCRAVLRLCEAATG